MNRKHGWSALLPLFLAACAPALGTGNVSATPPPRLEVAQPSPGSTSQGMTLSSPGFVNGGKLPAANVANAFGCTSANLSPELHWTGVPGAARSLVLTMYDPDAPTGSGFVHWLVYDLPASSTGLPAGAGSVGGPLPAGARQMNDAGTGGYLGACPPVGDKPHRYIFTLYALSEPLDAAPGSSAAVLGFSLNGKVLAKTSLTALYGR